jgi:ferritin-like metal-binding protein YciE
MPGLRSADQVLANELKEIYSAERQLTRTLPRLAKKASSERLREMLDQRREQGTMLIERLDEVFEEMQVSKGRVKNPVAEGLLDDVSHHLEMLDDEKLVDPVLLADTQKLEHYCIAAWGTARSLGRLLEEDKVVKTMEQVLEEGKRFDEELTKLAEDEVNPRMLGDEDENEEAEDNETENNGSRRRGSRRGRGR